MTNADCRFLLRLYDSGDKRKRQSAFVVMFIMIVECSEVCWK